MGNKDVCVAFIGCGNMGSALAKGLLDASDADSTNCPARKVRVIFFAYKIPLELVAHGITGLSAMLQNGAHPSLMREEVSSPRGCTIQTLMTAERAGTCATFAQALIDGVQHLDKAAAKNQKT